MILPVVEQLCHQLAKAAGHCVQILAAGSFVSGQPVKAGADGAALTGPAALGVLPAAGKQLFVSEAQQAAVVLPLILGVVVVQSYAQICTVIGGGGRSPFHTALSPEAQARYRTAYCGLCRRIDALHGLRGRFTLSYDLTFLDLLLCSLYEGESELSTGCSRCPVHPLHGVNWRSSGPTDYCADLSVALHYYNAEDKWKDDHNLLGLGYEKLLSGCRTDAEARWPRQCAAIRSCLARLAEYEAAGSEDLDAVSGCFGELMAELFDYKQDHWSPELRSLGFHLGKFIYLMDAYDDLARDKRKGAYNPLKTMSEQPGYEEEMREIFELLLARCAKCFERLPCVEDADLLRNILYSGVWLKYNCNNAKRSGRDAEAST